MEKNLPAMQETWVLFLSQENPLEEGMAAPFSILAWRIPRTEEPHWLQSIGSHRVRHDGNDLAGTHEIIAISGVFIEKMPEYFFPISDHDTTRASCVRVRMPSGQVQSYC